MPGLTITVAQQKGGAGKTTLSIHLAGAFAALGKTTALVDVDPQKSLSFWGEARKAHGWGAPHCTTLSGWRLSGELDKLRKGHDVVVIDSPPHADSDARVAIRAASLVVAPLQPSMLDVWATKATLELAKAEKRPTLIVVNRAPPRSKAAEAAILQAATLGAPIADTRIGSRTAYAGALADGRTVAEFDPSGAGAKEFLKLAQEILTRAGG